MDETLRRLARSTNPADKAKLARAEARTRPNFVPKKLLPCIDLYEYIRVRSNFPYTKKDIEMEVEAFTNWQTGPNVTVAREGTMRICLEGFIVFFPWVNRHYLKERADERFRMLVAPYHCGCLDNGHYFNCCGDYPEEDYSEGEE